MAYDKQTWINRVSKANAERLNHIEDGIYNVYNVSLIAITNIQPSECNTGDKYFNTNDNKIYTATATDTWSETGETPISDKTYVLTTDGSTYAFNGTTLTRIGGNYLEVQMFEFTIGTINPLSDLYDQTATLTIPSGYEAIGIVGHRLYGAYYSYCSLSSLYMTNNVVNYAIFNNNQYNSATDIACQLYVLLKKI